MLYYKPKITKKADSPGLQPKLKIGQPGDSYEREADAMADRVMRMTDSNPLQMQPLEEEEEMLQPKLRMQPLEEEEELLQPKIQRQEEEEELLQPKVQLQEEEEGEEIVQTKSSAPTNKEEAPPHIHNAIKSSHGKPLASNIRSFMESRFRTRLSKVRIHNGPDAVRMNKELGAQAFTHGNDIFFNKDKYNPETNTGKHLLAHELTHTIQQNKSFQPPAQQMIQRRALTSAEESTAIAHARMNYDVMSVRIIQEITGTGMDGDFGTLTAGAVSNFQTANAATIASDDGRVLQDTLDIMITNRVTAGQENQAIHLVTDFFNLDITSDTLSVHFEAGVSRPNPAAPPATIPADTDFESGGLRVIRIAAGAFTNAATLRDTIQGELNRAAPAFVGPVAPTPSVLNNTEERDAISYMNRHYQDPRSIMALQGQFVGVNPTGTVDPDLTQRIAEVQDTTAALADVDGMVGRFTLEHFFNQLRDAGDENAAMRLVMDFYDMPDFNNLLTIYYDASVGASTRRNPNGPTFVRLGLALYLPFEAMVHTLRHELEHVDQHRRGILSADTREFLAESTEIISRGMEHETLFTVHTPNPLGGGGTLMSGFQADLDRMIARWELMSDPDKRTYWSTMVRARRIIRARIGRTYRPTQTADQAEWAAATAAQQADMNALLVRVNAAARP